MEPRTAWILRIASAGALSVMASGCPNPNTYTTPRTIGSGHVSHSIAAEAWGFSVADATGTTTTTTTGTLPTFPTYTLRIGAGDSAEIGLRLANMTSLGTDLKFNFLRSERIDVAVDPGAQAFRLGTTTSDGSGNSVSSSVSVVYLHLPVLVGFNVSRAVSIVLAPGVTYGIASATASTSASGSEQASATTGVIGRFGLGFDFRVSSGFAVHPEVSVLRSFRSDPTLLYLIGVGFNFGSMANYDDVGGAPPPPPGPPPPPSVPRVDAPVPPPPA